MDIVANEIFIETNGGVMGPVDIETGFYLACEGDITTETRVKYAGDKNWQTAVEIDGLFYWHIDCPQCRERLRVNLDILGSFGRCPECGHEFPVTSPYESQAEPPAEEAPPRTASVPAPPPTAKSQAAAFEILINPEESWDDDAITCPHCWHAFPLGRLNYVASHVDLHGDPVLGQDAQIRFLPSTFTRDGMALDARGVPCGQKACPRCHLHIPNSLVDLESMFFSLIGAPSSGKSYFLTAMIHEIRRLLATRFSLLFQDADVTINRVLGSYEERLFLNPNPEDFVALPKTELQGQSFSNQVEIDGMILDLPLPLIFGLHPLPTHPRYDEEAETLRKNCIFYDNAGEHFLPGQDFASNPATLHLIKSSGIIFLFDPSVDARMRRLCRKDDPQLKHASKVLSQRDLLSEMINRIHKYSGMTQREKYEYPLVVNVGKFDMWSDQFGVDLAATPPYFTPPGSCCSVLDREVILQVSYELRGMLLEFAPEIVAMAEAFARQVYYVPTSSLGTSPEEMATASGVMLGVRPVNINPVWSEVPGMLLLASQNYIPFAAEKPPPSDADYGDFKIVHDHIVLTPPSLGRTISVPILYHGCCVHDRQEDVWFNMPPCDGSGLGAPADDFWSK